MCGLTGFWRPSSFSADDAHLTLLRMSKALRHRGPDDDGTWLDERAGLALAHRRLAILDVSPAGHQPMLSTSGRWVIAFNGEIYNHKELRHLLQSTGQAPNWRGHSDSETLLAAIQAWGLETTLRHCVGMFALALWDRETCSLSLARDRMGEKPLYYGWQDGVFLFGSELKSLRQHPAFIGEIDRGALALYFRHNCIPAPYSIYTGIHKLLPGTFLTIAARCASPALLPQPVAYWSIADVAEHGEGYPFSGSASEAADHLDGVLRHVVASQMIADVPLGAFLSGGIDSTTVVALMQAQASQPVRTFTIGFEEDGYNEAHHAAAVARHLGTDHTELYVSPNQAMAVIPRLPQLYDEPFADSSQIPTFLLAELAGRHVKVSLSGDGGDELFGGYNRYFWTESLWRRFNFIPRALRSRMSSMMKAPSPSTLNRAFAFTANLLPRSLRYSNPGDKLHKLADVFDSPGPEAMYGRLVSHWKQPDELVKGGLEPATFLTQPQSWPDLADVRHRLMYLDAVTYLPDDILVKVDRAAMGVSLETRVPLLDHRVVEFAWHLPLEMKIRGGQGKWLLRQVLNRYVPRELVERPKMGFGIPIDSWLRGPLREWAEHLLDEQQMIEAGYLHSAPVQRLWREHLSGKRNWQYLLWDVLMWEAWRRELSA